MQLLLADDFFFTAHDDTTGRIRLSEGRAGLGLGGALLGELLLLGSIDIERRAIVVRDAHPPEDSLARAVLEQLIRDESVTTVRDWLHYLGQDAYEQVAQRLLRAGHVRATQTRKMLRTQVVYLPVDINVAAWPAARLATRLSKREPLSTADVVLSGLIAATELEAQVFQYDSADIGRYLRQLLTTLPSPLRALLSETEAAVGDAVLSHRR
ncbi:MAG: GPP34 family phosphoprotein [Kutzneria sp.]|nr:GPP34 family phosphoprotein [Kutzneria sp.]